MKSYTDIEQSKKLAEILPLESADKHWIILDGAILRATVYDYFDLQEYNQDKGTLREYIPCWSLAALLDYLWANQGVIVKPYDNQWEVDCTVHVEYSKKLIDACYEMILKLYELKM